MTEWIAGGLDSGWLTAVGIRDLHRVIIAASHQQLA